MVGRKRLGYPKNFVSREVKQKSVIKVVRIVDAITSPTMHHNFRSFSPDMKSKEH